MERRQYEFSGYRLDAVSRELFGPDGTTISVTSKALDVLAYLIRQRDRVVDKDDLLAAVWAGRVVEENNLTQAISALRKAFGVRPPEHRFIVTISGRGYRFVADVNESGAVEAAIPAPPQTALAVLPFRSISSGPRDELLELGLTETLITQLSRVPYLRVRALGSSLHLAQEVAHDPDAAGRQLGAAFVIDGSAQQVGGRVRVNVRLLSVASGATVWADTIDTRVEDVFTLQDRISGAVVKALALPGIAMPERRRRSRRGDAEVYRAWLQGYHLLQRPDEGNLKKAISAFRRAIDLDAAYTRAYAGIAFAYRGLVHIDHEPGEMFGLAKAAVAQALKLDPDSPEALTAQGRIRHLYDWDWAGAEASLQRAIELNPSLMEARYACAHLLVHLGRFEEGLEQARQARELDPLSPMVNAIYAGLLTAAGQTEAAQKQVRRALELKPRFWVALQVRAGLAMGRGDTAAAMGDLASAVDDSDRASQILALQAIAHAAAGDRILPQEVLQELEARRTQRYVPATSFAAAHAALGNTDAALDELERAYRERDIRMAFMKVDARWNVLRAQPRFRVLAQHMGLVSDRGCSRL
ncbi:MAG: winged helix-turn-helix domain-containing tetratricopeptide repeat protein [Rhodanobacteraceae bacterium]